MNPNKAVSEVKAEEPEIGRPEIDLSPYGTKIARLTYDIPKKLKDHFKAVASQNGLSMKDALCYLMVSYIRENTQTQ